MARLLKAWGLGCAGRMPLEAGLFIVLGACFLGVIAVASQLPLPPEMEPSWELLMGAGLIVAAVGAVGPAARCRRSG